MQQFQQELPNHNAEIAVGAAAIVTGSLLFIARRYGATLVTRATLIALAPAVSTPALAAVGFAASAYGVVQIGDLFLNQYVFASQLAQLQQIQDKINQLVSQNSALHALINEGIVTLNELKQKKIHITESIHILYQQITILNNQNNALEAQCAVLRARILQLNGNLPILDLTAPQNLPLNHPA